MAFEPPKDYVDVAARITDGSEIVFLATHLGMAIRFDEADVRSMGRPAYGVRGIDLLMMSARTYAAALLEGFGTPSRMTTRAQSALRARRPSSCAC